MRVCYFGTYEKNYPINSVLIDGLRLNGVEVLECHVALWEKTAQKRARYFGLQSLLGLGVQYVFCCLRLLVKVRRLGHFDAIIVGFNGHADLILAWLVARQRGCKLVFNPALSIYDTIVIDKEFLRPGSLRARLVLGLERFLCRLPDAIFLDAEEHFRFFEMTLGCPRDKFNQLYFGADDQVFFPRVAKPDDGVFRVLFYGKFQPLQGAPYVVLAAKLLEDEGFEFEIVGSGPEEDKVGALLTELQPKNVRRQKWLDLDELATHIGDADVCLGIFGTSPKFHRCIANKVIQSLAMRKPVVTGRTRAMEELLRDQEHVLFCAAGDPQAIAASIRTLRDNPELADRLALAGYALFQSTCSAEAAGRKAKMHLQTLVGVAESWVSQE